MEDLIGQKLGQYEILSLLGTGGMARVYRCRQESMKRDVAIKVIRADLTGIENFIKRFEHEAQTVASLTHPHILKVFDYGQQGTIAYLVMELLTGGNLADLIRESPLAPDVAARILDQIASALDHAHQQGIIHRDLKPQNVLLDRNGNAYLTDFGIAKMLGESSNLTQPGTVMGTPSYMAPELWNGLPADARSDVYALGIMLFEMLNGRVPFSSDTPFSLMNLHINQSVPSIRQYRPDLPQSVEIVINKALSKQREARFGSAGDLAAALRLALNSEAPVTSTPASNHIDSDLTSPVPARSTPPSSPVGPTPLGTAPGGKSRLPLYIGLMAMLIVILGAAVVLIASNQNAATATPAALTGSPPGVAIVPTVTPSLIPSLTPGATLAATAQASLSTATTTLPAMTTVDYHTANAKTALAVQTLTAKASLPTKTPTPRPMTTIDYYTAQAKTALAAQTLTAKAFSRTPTPKPRPMTTIDYLTANAKTAMAVKVQMLTAEALTVTPTRRPARPTSTGVPAPALTVTQQAYDRVTASETARAVGSATPVPIANLPVGGGGQIAFISDRDGVNSLYVIDVGGGNLRRLSRNDEVADPAWSPDSTQIAFAVNAGGQWDIVTIPAGGGPVRRLTVGSGDERYPAWSPNGKQIAFVSVSAMNKSLSLSVINADGSGGRRLLQGVNAADPAWSPNGSQIAYAAQIDGQWDIYTIPAGGGEPRRLTVSSSDERYPAWSPDGAAIAYSATSGMRPGLFVIPANGNLSRHLTSTGETAHPTWSSDKSQIAYTARIGGQWDIYIIPALGGDAQRLTVSKGNDVSPAWSPGMRPAAPPAGTDICLQRDVLRIGISIDFPALGAVQDNPDVVHGFGVELANLLLEGKGIRHNFHGAPLELLIGPLVKGDYDFVMSQMPINEADAKVVNFSDPYFVIKQTVTIRQADKKQMQALADLRGRTVGVTQGEQGVEIAALLKKEFGGDLAVQTFANGTDAMQALVDRKVDAVIEDNLFALNFVVQHKDMNLITIETQRAITPLGIIVRKDCPALLALVNDSLTTIIRDGRYAKLYMDFFGVKPPDRLRP